MLISTGSEEVEILVVQILVGNLKIRILNGYGPQETELRGKILAFWQQFEAEIIEAKEDDCLVLIEIDANAKLGTNVIKNDIGNMEKFTRFTEDKLGLQNWKRIESPQVSFQRFANTLNHTFHRCFKKIRI